MGAQALESCRRVAAIVDAKEPAAEAEEYKHWVLWLGRRVATAAGEGTGLGLSICYQIVRDHRGEILVDSEPGKGATFTVVLPMDLGESAPLVGSSAANEVR